MWDDLPLHQLSQWRHRKRFAGVLTGSRLLAAAWATAKVHAAVIYHQHNNFAGFHRLDRSASVRVVSLQVGSQLIYKSSSPNVLTPGLGPRLLRIGPPAAVLGSTGRGAAARRETFERTAWTCLRL